jgi:hypothetical protein
MGQVVIAAKRLANPEAHLADVMVANAMERIVVVVADGPCAVTDPGIHGRFAATLAKPFMASLDQA